ncbi:MAG: hypothetical protein AB1716_18450, partial [Planctomycetota bacterium]
ARIRRELAAGTYFTPERVQAAVDCLVADLLAGTPAPSVMVGGLRMPGMFPRRHTHQQRTAHRWKRIAG